MKDDEICLNCGKLKGYYGLCDECRIIATAPQPNRLSWILFDNYYEIDFDKVETLEDLKSIIKMLNIKITNKTKEIEHFLKPVQK